MPHAVVLAGSELVKHAAEPATRNHDVAGRELRSPDIEVLAVRVRFEPAIEQLGNRELLPLAQTRSATCHPLSLVGVSSRTRKGYYMQITQSAALSLMGAPASGGEGLEVVFDVGADWIERNLGDS